MPANTLESMGNMQVISTSDSATLFAGAPRPHINLSYSS